MYYQIGTTRGKHCCNPDAISIFGFVIFSWSRAIDAFICIVNMSSILYRHIRRRSQNNSKKHDQLLQLWIKTLWKRCTVKCYNSLYRCLREHYMCFIAALPWTLHCVGLFLPGWIIMFNVKSHQTNDHWNWWVLIPSYRLWKMFCVNIIIIYFCSGSKESHLPVTRIWAAWNLKVHFYLHEPVNLSDV